MAVKRTLAISAAAVVLTWMFSSRAEATFTVGSNSFTTEWEELFGGSGSISGVDGFVSGGSGPGWYMNWSDPGPGSASISGGNLNVNVRKTTVFYNTPPLAAYHSGSETEWAYQYRVFVDALGGNTSGQEMLSLFGDIQLFAHEGFATTTFSLRIANNYSSSVGDHITTLNQDQWYTIGVHRKVSGLYDIYVDNALVGLNKASQTVGTPTEIRVGTPGSTANLTASYDFFRFGELTQEVSSAPEPSTYWLAASGLLGMGMFALWKKYPRA